MSSGRNDNTCQTCTHWQVFPENNLAGRCPVLGAQLWPQMDTADEDVLQMNSEHGIRLLAEISLTFISGRYFGLEKPVSDVIAVRTLRDFGCIKYEPAHPK